MCDIIIKTVKSTLNHSNIQTQTLNNFFIFKMYNPGEGNDNPLQYSCWKTPWTQDPGRIQSVELQESDMTEHAHTQNVKV